MELKEFKKLKVGDKVQIVSSVPDTSNDEWNPYWNHHLMDEWLDKVMTVKCRDVHGNLRMVEQPNIHWSESMIKKKVEAETIVIKSDGKTVTAYRGKEKGVAICSPEDEFDLYTGASIALGRLFGEDKKHHSYSFPMKGTLNVEFDDDKMSGSIKFDAPTAEASMKEKKTDIPVTYVRLTDSDVITSAKDTHKEQPKQFKPGDKVRIVSTRPDRDACWTSKMDKWLGKVMTIRDLYTDLVYHMEEDREEWYGCCGEGFLWKKDWIEKKVDNKLYGLGDYTLLKSVGDSAKSAKDAIDGLTYAWGVVDEPQSKPEVKEVKRTAKVGEWIKVVNPIGDTAYAEGDIYKVTKVRTGVLGIEWAHVNKLYKNGNSVFISADEYVVLEGYEPPKPKVKEVKRPAKVKEWIKIVKPICTAGLYDTGDILQVESTLGLSRGVDVHIPEKDKTFYVGHEEYVVLEDYNP